MMPPHSDLRWWRTALLLASATFVAAVAVACVPNTRDLEAEAATLSQATVESVHAGYSGTGYVNYADRAGGYVEWSFDVASEGRLDLTVRYANGSTADRPLSFWVDGVLSEAAQSFPPTGAWTNWREKTVSVAVPSGSTVVRAVATAATGGPNVDRLHTNATAIDLSSAVVAKTTDDFSLPVDDPKLSPAGAYRHALYFMGQYRAYQRTGDPDSLAYLRRWVDRSFPTTSVGTVANLDRLLAGNLLLFLHAETGVQRYADTANNLRRGLDTYPRTTDGALLHNASVPGELWADGTYMATPFIARQGAALGAASRLEAENATLFRAVVATNHPGYQGTGFVDYANVVGGFVEWRTAQAIAGPANLTIRYANGTTADRPLALSVNGGAPTTVSFPPTGGWSTWSTRTVRLGLPAGPLAIRATATTATGGPNVDWLKRDDAGTEAAGQLVRYAAHLQDPASGLLFHGYDETGSAPWVYADDHSRWQWGRGMGWFGMATVDVLDVLPADHPARATLLTNLRRYAAGLVAAQDPATGRWLQVLNAPGASGNWLETSGSAMFTYTLSRGVERGYLDPSYGTAARRGHLGVLATLTFGTGDDVSITDISEGTNVMAELGSYLAANKRLTDDPHGLGAFLLMNEQVAH